MLPWSVTVVVKYPGECGKAPPLQFKIALLLVPHTLFNPESKSLASRITIILRNWDSWQLANHTTFPTSSSMCTLDLLPEETLGMAIVLAQK